MEAVMRPASFLQLKDHDLARFREFLEWAVQEPLGSCHFFVAGWNRLRGRRRNQLTHPDRHARIAHMYPANHDWRARIGVTDDDCRPASVNVVGT